ncbi:hypothetical protein PMAYCL1PPCAC_02094, partial [Pristionchus mayeri]
NGSIMRITCSLRAIIRSHHEALDDMKAVLAITKQYGMADPTKQPVDAQPFSISSTQGPMYLHQLSTELSFDNRYPRPFKNRRQDLFQRMLSTVVDTKWIMHRSVFLGAKNAFADRDKIVHGSRAALSGILDAIRNKDLSSLSPVLLDDGILPDIEKISDLSSLTDRQLSCLEVSDDDFVGIDGIVDTWKRMDLAEDDPSGLLSSLRLGISEKQEKPILTYSVDMMAILRKNILLTKGSAPPQDQVFESVPSAYGLPYFRVLYATVEFAHLSASKLGEFSDEPFLLNFHVHSF